MSMPPELSMPVQRGLRTMISGVMLVQCFTVYVYLATYIVLLYPVFLEERPNLLLPWLLLAAIRKFLCELTSLALGLGTCVLLGPARPPCIKFVVFKIASITPAFYMWMLVLSYYNTLKVAAAFKRFPTVMQSSDHDYGLELAVRRRRTKSLQDEEQLRRKLVASFNYGDRTATPQISTAPRLKSEIASRMAHSTHVDFENMKAELEEALGPPIIIPGPTDRVMADLGSYEDWCGSEMIVPRDTDRILEQFAIMMLRIGSFLKVEGSYAIKRFTSQTNAENPPDNMDCTAMQSQNSDTPPLVGTSKQNTAAYLQDYPQIFMKKPYETDQLNVNDPESTKLKEPTLISQTQSHKTTENNATSLSPRILLENYDIDSITLNRKSSLDKYHNNEIPENQNGTMTPKSEQKSETNNSTDALKINSKSLVSQYFDQNVGLEMQYSNPSVSKNYTKEAPDTLQDNINTVLPLEEQTIYTVDLDNKPETHTTMTERDIKQMSDELYPTSLISFQTDLNTRRSITILSSSLESLEKYEKNIEENQHKNENLTKDTENEADNPSSTQANQRSSNSVTESKKEK
ncbi:uncharacterized protein LOC126369038 [Pectinophora gossypiella]|uniref:uncharacterized protein LOC126369038 n=1 Tax=Pectinophora gossypiella TaxID=13191 RepID=UPI00214E0F34|nr:uncharacterized protein LOC126369038 [Pectinophora gossypiella]XP_049869280.1 uncharacterized protein LOC126369038 [Pectinophora gossypiella]XP_049869281.1 uncharacterized protein LOC126369038 [Pectinophora gossypiella]